VKLSKSQLKQIIKEELEKVLSEEEDTISEVALNELHPDNPFLRQDAPALVNCDKVRAMKKTLEAEREEASIEGWEPTWDNPRGGSPSIESVEAKREQVKVLTRQLKYLTTAPHWQDCWQGMEKPFKGTGLGESKN